MTSLAALLSALMSTLQVFPLCDRVKVTETKAFAADQFFFKLRAELHHGTHFQVRVYYNQGHVDYAYQLFAAVPLLRWDNKEEFPHLPTYPHHHHDASGGIKSSPLTGNPVEDIEVVLREIAAFLH